MITMEPASEFSGSKPPYPAHRHPHRCMKLLDSLYSWNLAALGHSRQTQDVERHVDEAAAS
jgi:hypothetical protein